MNFLERFGSFFSTAAPNPDSAPYLPYLQRGEFDLAMPLLMERIRLDDGAAMSCYGTLLLTGQGVPQDFAGAAMWYRQAAVRNDATGMAGLGMLYSLGRGVDQDLGEAALWLWKATNSKHQRAATALLHLLSAHPKLFGVHFTEEAFNSSYANAFDDNESFMVQLQRDGNSLH